MTEALDWKRLGRLLAAARDAMQPSLIQDEVAALLGVGRTTVQKIERGHRYARVQPVHRAYAHLVGWTGGSVDRVLSGGEPVIRSADHRAAAAIADGAAPGDLSVRVLQALTEGPLIDSDVITIRSPSGREVRAVLIVRGEPGDTEELQRDLRAWRDRAAALAEPGDVDSDVSSETDI